MEYLLTIITDEISYQHECHLGTDLKVAMDCAEEICNKRIPRFGRKIIFVKLYNEYSIFAYSNHNWFIHDSYEGWKLFSK